MTMENLRPCPFCGGDDISIHEERDAPHGRQQFFAECAGCCATVWGACAITRAKAYVNAEQAWNRRNGGSDAD